MTMDMIKNITDYIDNQFASELTAIIDEDAWVTDLKRRVQHHGYRYDYKARSIDTRDALGPLPEPLAGLARQLADDGIFAVPPDQVIVNEYLPGQGIAPHTDCIPCFGPVIASLSLGSACTMRLTGPARNGQDRDETIDLRLHPGSLLVLSGDARYRWRHGIPARKSDMVDGVRVPRSRRVSLTFRTVLTS